MESNQMALKERFMELRRLSKESDDASAAYIKQNFSEEEINLLCEALTHVCAEQAAESFTNHITSAEVKRITMEIDWDEVKRREQQCRELCITEPANSPYFCKMMTIAAIYEAGRIDGIRGERARRNGKH